MQNQKINVDVDRMTELFSIANSIQKPPYARIAALVNDLGIDKAERAMLILAGENPDAPYDRSALSGKQSNATILTKSKSAQSPSLVDQALTQKAQGKQSLIDELLGSKK